MSNLQELIKATQLTKHLKPLTPPPNPAVGAYKVSPVFAPSIVNYNNIRTFLMTTVVPALKAERARVGLTQRQVANLANVSQTTINRIEQGYTQNIHAYIAVILALNLKLNISS